MFWLGILCAVLGITVVILLVKIALLHRAADEIHSQFVKKLENDTNTLILLSTRDRYMCRLAEEINVQLRELRAQRRRFQQGEIELKEAVTNMRLPGSAGTGRNIRDSRQIPDGHKRAFRNIKTAHGGTFPLLCDHISTQGRQ